MNSKQKEEKNELRDAMIQRASELRRDKENKLRDAMNRRASEFESSINKENELRDAMIQRAKELRIEKQKADIVAPDQVLIHNA